MKYYDIRMLENSNDLYINSKIVIYGTGGKGKIIKSLFENAAIDIWGFCDSDDNKADEAINLGMACYSPHKIYELVCNTSDTVYIVACIPHPKEAWDLFSDIFKTNSDNVRFVTFWGISQFFFQFKDYIFKNNKSVQTRYAMENCRREKIIELAFYNKLIEIMDDSCIWNIQPGKTGSITVNNMLLEKGIKVIHGHWIEFPCWGIEAHRDIWKEAVRHRKTKGLKAICMVRNPLDRDYSAFWQPFTEDNPRIILHSEPNCLQEKYDKYIENVVMNNNPENEYKTFCPGTWKDEFLWFDKEIKNTLGIDIYNFPFNIEKGYSIIKVDNIQLFVGKLEKLANYVDKLGEFVEKPLSLMEANSAENKWYSMAYKAFRKEVKIRKNYVEHYFLNNHRVDYFYSKSEQQQFMSKWENNII